MSARRAVQKGRGVGAPAAVWVSVCACDLVACDNVNHREGPFAFIPLLGLARLACPVLVAHVSLCVCVCALARFLVFFCFFGGGAALPLQTLLKLLDADFGYLATWLFSVNSSTRGAAFRWELIVEILSWASWFPGFPGCHVLASSLCVPHRARPVLFSCLSESRVLLCGSEKNSIQPVQKWAIRAVSCQDLCQCVSEHCTSASERGREWVSRRTSFRPALFVVLRVLAYVSWPCLQFLFCRKGQQRLNIVRMCTRKQILKSDKCLLAKIIKICMNKKTESLKSIYLFFPWNHIKD